MHPPGAEIAWTVETLHGERRDVVATVRGQRLEEAVARKSYNFNERRYNPRDRRLPADAEHVPNDGLIK
jgi:hypothetical protein